MPYEILQYYNFTEDARPIELMIQIEDNRLLVIFGRHIDGYFIAIPKINISCEAISPDAVQKNKIFLTQAGVRSDYALAICQAICETWNKIGA